MVSRAATRLLSIDCSGENPRLVPSGAAEPLRLEVEALPERLEAAYWAAVEGFENSQALCIFREPVPGEMEQLLADAGPVLGPSAPGSVYPWTAAHGTTWTSMPEPGFQPEDCNCVLVIDVERARDFLAGREVAGPPSGQHVRFPCIYLPGMGVPEESQLGALAAAVTIGLLGRSLLKSMPH